MRPSWSTLWLFVTSVVLASAHDVAAQGYAAQVYTEADGLPDQSVVDIEQTSDGRLWFATRSGLVTFDCTDWSREQAASAQVDPSDAKRRLALDARGGLWAFRQRAPFDGRYLVDEQWRPFPPIPATIEQKGEGPLAGVELIGHGEDRQILLVTVAGAMFLHDGAAWRRLPHALGEVRATCAFGGRFLVAHERGLHALSAGSGDWTELSGAHEAPMAIGTDRDRKTCWLVGRTWTGRLDGDRVELLHEGGRELFFPDIARATLVADERGGIYFGGRGSAFHFSPQRGLERLDPDGALGDIELNTLFMDREGLIWAGGSRGVAKLAGQFLSNRTRAHGLAEEEVSALIELQDGRVLAGHNRSVTLLSDPPQALKLDERRSQSRVMSIAQTADGAVYLAASRGGLLRLHLDPLAVERVEDPAARLRAVTGVSCAPDGDLVVAGTNGVWRYDGRGFEPMLDARADAKQPLIRQAVTSREGLLVALRNEGVQRVHNGEVSRWRGETAGTDDCYCVRSCEDGAIWAGTAAGAVQTTSDGSLQLIDFGGQQLRAPVYAMTTDALGRTWFGTNNGVAVWNGERLRRITEDHGTAGREANRGALLCDRDGRVWVGFDRGLTTFDSRLELPPRHGPSVSMLTPVVNGRVRRSDGWAPILEHSSLRFRVRSISSRDGPQLLHEHWLEGLEDGYSRPRALTERRLDYAGLSLGRYRLHVRVTDSTGMSAETTSPWIEVRQRWHHLWWFRALALIGALTALGVIVAYWTQRRHSRKLEEIVLNRTVDLSAERNRLQATLGSIGDGVVAVDDDDRIALWNPTAQQLTGWDDAFAHGRQLDELMPGVSAKAPIDPNQAVEITVADGTSRWFEYTVAKVTAEGDGGYVIAFRDVTERREQDRLMSRNDRLESLGVLAGGIAHDFNNLLTVMLGNLSLLELDDDEQQDAAAAEKRQLRVDIQEAVLRARDLTQQLLTFSKGGAPVRRPGHLGEVVEESARLALSGANVDCDIEVDPQLLPAEFDRGQMSQVLHNLVLNARQAMPEGGTVTIRAYPSERCPNGHEIPHSVVEIRDTGAGIAPDELERIFDPYYSTKPEGTGLGLSTAHSIVKRHGGYLTAESQLGAGSVFRVFLPALTDSGSTVDDAEAALPTTVAKGAKVLCMDDDASIRAFLRSSMTTLGHSPHLVSEGSEAIAAYRHARERGRPFDYVLLDMTIPGGMGGIETLARLRELDPDVVAIAATGYSTAPVLEEFRQHGFVTSLCKPFSVRDIAEALTRAQQRAD